MNSLEFHNLKGVRTPRLLPTLAVGLGAALLRAEPGGTGAGLAAPSRAGRARDSRVGIGATRRAADGAPRRRRQRPRAAGGGTGGAAAHGGRSRGGRRGGGGAREARGAGAGGARGGAGGGGRRAGDGAEARRAGAGHAQLPGGDTDTPHAPPLVPTP